MPAWMRGLEPVTDKAIVECVSNALLKDDMFYIEYEHDGERTLRLVRPLALLHSFIRAEQMRPWLGAGENRIRAFRLDRIRAIWPVDSRPMV